MINMMNYNIKEDLPDYQSHYYRSLCPQDSLYLHNLHLLKHSPHQILIHTLLKDFNFLLYLNRCQFLNQLDQSSTLQTCLESFLSVLPRRSYAHYQGNQHPLEHIFTTDSCFEKHSHLLEAFLLIFYRISSESHLITSNILSIPNLLDIAAIFGPSNPKIVKNIILNVYNGNPYSHRDIFLFFDALYEHDLLTDQEEKLKLQIDLTQKSLKRKHFHNRQKFLLQMVTKQIFKIKDFLLNLSNFLKYFPQIYTSYFASNYAFQDTLVQNLLLFLKEISNWKLQHYLDIFTFHFHDIRQTISQYLVLLFKELKNILDQGSNQDQQTRNDAQVTYQRLFLNLDIQTNDENSYEKSILRNLVENQLGQHLTIFPYKHLTNKISQNLYSSRAKELTQIGMFQEDVEIFEVSKEVLPIDLKYGVNRFYSLEYEDQFEQEQYKQYFLVYYDQDDKDKVQQDKQLSSFGVQQSLYFNKKTQKPMIPFQEQVNSHNKSKISQEKINLSIFDPESTPISISDLTLSRIENNSYMENDSTLKYFFKNDQNQEEVFENFLEQIETTFIEKSELTFFDPKSQEKYGLQKYNEKTNKELSFVL